MLGAMTARLSPLTEDPPFIVTRTMGSMGPRVRPDGFAEGRICRVCGVVFFAPLQEVAASRETLVPLMDGSYTSVETFPRVGPEVSYGHDDPGADDDLRGMRVEKLVIPSDATEATMEALKEAGYQPLGDGYVVVEEVDDGKDARIAPEASEVERLCPRCGNTGRGEGGRPCGYCWKGKRS